MYCESNMHIYAIFQESPTPLGLLALLAFLDAETGMCICVEAKASYNMIMLHSTHLLFLYFCNKGMKDEYSCPSIFLFSLKVKFS